MYLPADSNYTGHGRTDGRDYSAAAGGLLAGNIAGAAGGGIEPFTGR